MEGAAEKFKEQRKLDNLLVLACTRGYLGDVQELLDRGANIAAQDKKKISALHFAAGQGRLEVLKFLRSKGAELDLEDPKGRSLVHMAVLGNHPQVVEFLLSKGAWPEGNDANDDTPLHLAARQGSQELVEILLRGGAKATLNELNKRNLTPLGEAVAGGHTKLVQLMIKQGANVEKRAREWSLLHIAAGLGHTSIVKTLLSAGLNINDQTNPEGITPLHAAASSKSIAAVQALLQAKADKSAVTRAGGTAHELAPAGKEWDVLQTAARKAVPIASKASDPVGPLSAIDRFKALTADERLVKVAQWTRLDTDAQVDKAAADLGPAAREQLVEARRALQFLTITKAIADLHQDDDFQRLASQPGVEAIINELRQNGDAVERYKADADIMEVLTKLRRFQMVIRANGRHTVPFESLLTKNEADWGEKDAARLSGMKANYEGCLLGVIRAITGDAGREVAAVEGVTAPLPVHSRDGDPVLEQATADMSRDIPSAAQPVGVDQLPRTFTWKEFWMAMLRQALQSGVMGIFFIVGLWMMGRLPWQQASSHQHDPKQDDVFLDRTEL